MIVSIHQPQYLPWLGYLHKILNSDLFIVLDNVQYVKNEWQNRNRIKTPRGWQWITVPVEFHHGEKIRDVRINNRENWRRKHRNALITNYSQAPYFKEYFPFFEKAYAREWSSLAAINIFFIRYFLDVLDLKVETVKAPQFPQVEEPTERLVALCKQVGARCYLSGVKGRQYLDLKRFEDEGIEVVFQDFIHPVYPQLYGEFQPNMSIVDLLFNCGPHSPGVLTGQSKGDAHEHPGHRRSS
jgi:hypothetical protein